MAKIIKLTENQFGEMMAYHGSNTDFNKFNHKKYLSKGAGSQSFGWGTYVTNDRTIGMGYANSSIDVYRHMDELPDVLYYELGLNNDESFDVIEQFFKFTNGFNIPVKNINRKITKRDIQGYAGGYEKYLDSFVVIINYCLSDSNRENTLYEVDIPDDNGFNYLPWYNILTNEQFDAIESKLKEFSKKHNTTSYIIRFARNKNTGKDVYYALGERFAVANEMIPNFTDTWVKKAASLFLMQCGFDGIKYQSGTKWQKPKGAAEDAMNYVIFDANKVKIINKTKV